jgi:hypothetical protein
MSIRRRGVVERYRRVVEAGLYEQSCQLKLPVKSDVAFEGASPMSNGMQVGVEYGGGFHMSNAPCRQDPPPGSESDRARRASNWCESPGERSHCDALEEELAWQEEGRKGKKMNRVRGNVRAWGSGARTRRSG